MICETKVVGRRSARTVIRRTESNDGPVPNVFRKHRGPCGQPAVEGEIGRFRPVPAQAGHCKRINATPSDLPFKSTGFATNPVPPQFGQLSGSTPLPLLVESIVSDITTIFAAKCCALRITNKNSWRGRHPWVRITRAGKELNEARCRLRVSNFAVFVAGLAGSLSASRPERSAP